MQDDGAVTLVPSDTAAYNAFSERASPWDRTEAVDESVYNTTSAADTRARIDELLAFYHGAGAADTFSCDGVETGGSGVEVRRVGRSSCSPFVPLS